MSHRSIEMMYDTVYPFSVSSTFLDVVDPVVAVMLLAHSVTHVMRFVKSSSFMLILFLTQSPNSSHSGIDVDEPL